MLVAARVLLIWLKWMRVSLSIRVAMMAMPKAPPRLRSTLSRVEEEGISSGLRLAVATRESGTMTKGWPSARTISDWISWGPA
ncbi:hypothetical protein D3C79_631540 [compost metagenome]